MNPDLCRVIRLLEAREWQENGMRRFWMYYESTQTLPSPLTASHFVGVTIEITSFSTG